MTPARPRPRFSIVSAVYNVEPYLPDFIASIEALRFNLGRIEVIAVDDGSTDGSLALLEAWAARRPELVTVLTKENGGQGSARNLGLDRATGEWVTFTDPDDMLDHDFFSVADRFANAHPDVEILAARPLILRESTGRIGDTHPRRAQFRAGDRPVDLERDPNTFTGSATTLYRLDRIRALALRFDTRIRPIFEDGHFAIRYLLGLPHPTVGVLRDAIYIYRKRVAKDSTLQRSLSHPGRYTDVLRFGYLDVLERAKAMHGSVPAWLQQVVIYELSWFLSEDEKVGSNVRLAPDLVPTFHDLLAEILRRLDPEVVRRHSVRPLTSVWADVLAHACRRDDWHSTVAARTKVDPRMGQQRISFRYVGSEPAEAFLADGAAVDPIHAKTMSYVYYGRALMQERILWLPAHGELRVLVDGSPLTILDGWPEPAPVGRDRDPEERTPRTMARLLVIPVKRRAARVRRLVVRAALRAVARSWPFRSTFRHAWVLMDRIETANDNGERLFDYIRAERSDINAWFVIGKDTADWDRMRAAGVARLVSYGSFRWKVLMLSCDWLLSSYPGHSIAGPSRAIRIAGKPTWKSGFLQHGVIQSDMSRWFNRFDFDFFVASTIDELRLVADDGTSYRYTSKEIRVTGMPRLDRLLAKGRSIEPEDRDLVIVAPAWRRWLAFEVDPRTGRRSIDPGLWELDFLRSWMALIGSPEITAAAARRGWRVVFMPHPNLQALLPRIGLPAHVEGLALAEVDVQEICARAALLVTDDSSMAFDVAALDRPIVYVQIEPDELLGGARDAAAGSFDHVRDGFGPVATDLAGAVEAIVASIHAGPHPSPTYQVRIDRSLTSRDGQACARVVVAVEELSRPCVTSEVSVP